MGNPRHLNCIGHTFFPKRVDAIGLVTARSGVRITTGGLEVSAGVATVAGQTNLANVNVSAGVTVSGMTSAAGGFRAQGVLVEAFSSTTTAWSTTNDLNITNGNLFFTSGNLGGTTNTLDIYSTTGINTDLAVGQAINVTGITSVNATTAYVNAITIDGIANEVNWVGGTAPAAGGGSGFDTYTFNILKVGNATFHVIGNQVLSLIHISEPTRPY